VYNVNWFTIHTCVAVSQQLCSSVADQLTRTADSVVQLYKRVALEDDQTDHRDMLRGLEEAIGEAQRTLRHVVVAGETGAAVAAESNVASKLQDIVASSGQGDQANVVAMMQQYSDMLLTMVQQRMGSNVTPNPQKPS
jgi:adenosyl cobinamide kinase/adenosyl cobinamide phosphate guanylyltransferase